MLSEQINGNYTNVAYNMIVNDILNSVLNEGDKLNEQELISKFGFSRTPIREALIMLERDGFVKTVGREGTYVRKLTPKDIREIYIVREALESMAARLGANTISVDDLSILANIVSKMDAVLENDNYDDFVLLDMEFHRMIVDSCHIGLLSNICYNLGILSVSIKSKGSNYKSNIKEYQRQHREILKAFEQRDVVSAESLLSAHIQKGKLDLLLVT